MLWDAGRGSRRGSRAGYAKGHLKFELHGEKLHGRLVAGAHARQQIRRQGQGGVAAHQGEGRTPRKAAAPIVDLAPDSVRRAATRRDRGRATTYGTRSCRRSQRKGRRRRSPRREEQSRQEHAKLRASAGAQRAALPACMAPMLATLVDRAAGGDDWVHEIKYDGYRMLARIEGQGAPFFPQRQGLDGQVRRRSRARSRSCRCESAGSTAKSCALDAQGRSSFQTLQNALATRGARAQVLAFDVVYLDGHDLREVAAVRAQAHAARHHRRRVRISCASDRRCRRGRRVLAAGCALGLEGAVCKRLDSHLYRRRAHARLGQSEMHASGRRW